MPGNAISHQNLAGSVSLLWSNREEHFSTMTPHPLRIPASPMSTLVNFAQR